MINVDNRNRANLYHNSDNELGVGSPIKLALNKHDNEVFWIDYGRGAVPKKIGAVKMDGTNARIIVKDNLNEPSDLYFHENSRRLYWCDTGKIIKNLRKSTFYLLIIIK